MSGRNAVNNATNKPPFPSNPSSVIGPIPSKVLRLTAKSPGLTKLIKLDPNKRSKIIVPNKIFDFEGNQLIPIKKIASNATGQHVYRTMLNNTPPRTVVKLKKTAQRSVSMTSRNTVNTTAAKNDDVIIIDDIAPDNLPKNVTGLKQSGNIIVGAVDKVARRVPNCNSQHVATTAGDKLTAKSNDDVIVIEDPSQEKSPAVIEHSVKGTQSKNDAVCKTAATNEVGALGESAINKEAENLKTTTENKSLDEKLVVGITDREKANVSCNLGQKKSAEVVETQDSVATTNTAAVKPIETFDLTNDDDSTEETVREKKITAGVLGSKAMQHVTNRFMNDDDVIMLEDDIKVEKEKVAAGKVIEVKDSVVTCKTDNDNGLNEENKDDWKKFLRTETVSTKHKEDNSENVIGTSTPEQMEVASSVIESATANLAEKNIKQTDKTSNETPNAKESQEQMKRNNETCENEKVVKNSKDIPHEVSIQNIDEVPPNINKSEDLMDIENKADTIVNSNEDLIEEAVS